MDGCWDIGGYWDVGMLRDTLDVGGEMRGEVKREEERDKGGEKSRAVHGIHQKREKKVVGRN
jgi:hypothetical protein